MALRCLALPLRVKAGIISPINSFGPELPLIVPDPVKLFLPASTGRDTREQSNAVATSLLDVPLGSAAMDETGRFNGMSPATRLYRTSTAKSSRLPLMRGDSAGFDS